jgi:hypothetical protein
MGEGLKQEIEFLQGLKNKQLLHVAPEDYLYTWGMSMENGKIVTSSSFNVSFHPVNATYKASLKSELGKKLTQQIKDYFKVGELLKGISYYKIPAELSSMLVWEKY